MIQWYHFTAWVPKNASGKFQPITVQGGVDSMAGGDHAPQHKPGAQGAGGVQDWGQDNVLESKSQLDLQSIPGDELGSGMRDYTARIKNRAIREHRSKHVRKTHVLNRCHQHAWPCGLEGDGPAGKPGLQNGGSSRQPSPRRRTIPPPSLRPPRHRQETETLHPGASKLETGHHGPPPPHTLRSPHTQWAQGYALPQPDKRTSPTPSRCDFPDSLSAPPPPRPFCQSRNLARGCLQ